MSRTVSVVLPCFNRASILPRAISSVFKQTFAPNEIIVVDDGSTDSSAEIAASMTGPISVRVIRQENAGASAARNAGLKVARSGWVAFLDSDDAWHPRKLELQMATAERYSAAKLIFCDTLSRNDSGVVMPSRFALGGLLGMETVRDGTSCLYDRSLFRRMIGRSRVITSAVIVRRDLPELVFQEDVWGSEDWDLWLRLAARYPFASVNQVLVTMHLQGDNISQKKGRLYRNDVRVLQRLLEDDVLSRDEKNEIASAIRSRRIGAIYHSLVCGETRETRELLGDVPAGDLGIGKHILYRFLSMLPPRFVARIASMRLGTGEV